MSFGRIQDNSKALANRLIAHNSHCGCGCQARNSPSDIFAAAQAIQTGGRSKQAGGSRSYATPVDMSMQKEYAFEVSRTGYKTK